MKVFWVVTIIEVERDSYCHLVSGLQGYYISQCAGHSQRIIVSPKMSIVSVVSRVMASKNVYALITRALSDKRDLADVINDLEMKTVSWIAQWTQCNHKCFIRGRFDYRREDHITKEIEVMWPQAKKC